MTASTFACCTAGTEFTPSRVEPFYPPNAVVFLAPERAVDATLSWVIAMHVLAAGMFAFAYARSYHLSEPGSLVAAVGFMSSSKWMTHLLLAGHTVTIGLAWLPLVLLAVERGVANWSAWAVGAAGIALAVLGLGTHPQWAFYAGVFAVAWTVPAERPPSRVLGRSLPCVWITRLRDPAPPTSPPTPAVVARPASAAHAERGC